MPHIHVSIVTPEATAFEQEVESIVVPMIDGELGILSGHAPMIGRLGPGELRAREGSNVHRFYVDGGFVQVDNNRVSVLTGNCLPASQINISQAKSDLARARELTADKPEQMALKRKSVAQAVAQIRIAEKIQA